MFSLIRTVTLIFTVTCIQIASGYTWIAVTNNDSIPINAVKLEKRSLVTYVGRARHRNLVLPAEIYNSSLASIAWNSKIYDKSEFEILIADEVCEWKTFVSLSDIPDNVVRAGTYWNGEPIYVGKTDYKPWNGFGEILAVLLTSNRVIKWPEAIGHKKYALVCDDTNKWVDAISGSPPDNAVSGELYRGDQGFVGRLLVESSFIPGQVKPYLGITTAYLREGGSVQSPYCEILVGGPNEYIWKSTRKGQIPDYAVVGGRSDKNQIRYVAKNININELKYVEYGTFAIDSSSYEFLVRNVTYLI